jgi:hypothetical protein
LPGCKNERGTQHGASRNKPPLFSSALSTSARTFFVMVFKDVTLCIKVLGSNG